MCILSFLLANGAVTLMIITQLIYAGNATVASLLCTEGPEL